MQGNLFYPSVPGWQKTDTSKTAAKEIAPSAKTVRALVLHQLKERSLTT